MEKKWKKKLIEWGLKLKSKKQRGQWYTLLERKKTKIKRPPVIIRLL